MRSKSGIAYASNLLPISRSASTSFIQYNLNSSHFSISCSGKLRSRIPFAFVGLIGIEKYRISALPVESFPFSSSFKASDTMAKDNGNPQYAALTAEQYH